MSFWKMLLASILGVFSALVLFTVIGIFFIIALVGSLADSVESENIVSVSEGTLLRLHLAHGLSEYGLVNPFSESGDTPDSFRGLLAGLNRAIDDPNVHGLLLEVGGYSGNWAQAGELRRKLAAFRESGKSIYAVSDVNGMREIDYYLALEADTIIFEPTAMLEINGLAAQMVFFKPLLDKLGIKAEVVRAGAYKSAVEPYTRSSASPESEQMMGSLINGLFDEFRDVVMQRREISAEQLRTILDERAVLTAWEAYNEGLIDGVMYSDEFRAMLSDRMGKETYDDLSIVSMGKYASADGFPDLGNSNQIAVVYAVGTITSGESNFDPDPIFGGTETIGSETFVQAMRDARDNDLIKAVVLRINSPGGQANATEAMWREIQLTREVKPVIVSMGDFAASGGYFLAAAGDIVVADPATLTGSIGVFGMYFTLQELFSDIGVNVQTVTTNPHADMFSLTESPDEFELKLRERSVDSTYQMFLKIVADGRGLSVDSVRSLAEGRVWTGRQAQRVGLVDSLGGLEAAIEIAAAKVGFSGPDEYRLRILPEPPSIFDVIMDRFGSLGAGMLAKDQPESVDLYARALEYLQGHQGVQARMIDLKFK